MNPNESSRMAQQQTKVDSSPDHPETLDATKPLAARRRDANQTRRLLIEAARRRFASEGYAATTVRQIAEDAGVNVALISRYFESKEGLFEACLESAVRALSESTGEVSELPQVAEAISRYAIGSGSEGGLARALLLLLRSSGDERAEQVRIGMLRAFGERIASAAGWTPGHPKADDLLLRAQLVLAVGVGIAVLSASSRLEPLTSAGYAEIAGPMREFVRAVMGESAHWE
jgi:AcrR family transcriptional regulator